MSKHKESNIKTEAKKAIVLNVIDLAYAALKRGLKRNKKTESK